MSITENPSTAWIPEKSGDSVTGKVATLDYVQHDGGGRYEPRRVLVVTVDQDGGQTAIWAWHTVLHRKLHELRPAIGETLTVTYLGRVAPKGGSGQPWANYNATVAERPAEGFAWQEQPDEATAEQPAELPTDTSAMADTDDDDAIPF